MTSRASNTPACSVPSIRNIVVFGVDVISTKLLSGRTIRGTVRVARSRIVNCARASTRSIAYGFEIGIEFRLAARRLELVNGVMLPGT